ncbi:hypothetical protein BBJ28_00021741 [Nothophytophthora sp. Chile5]|nr:hypothetical protein BBJ28_00021741 [Nothophytophthora sp. Chile5]
MLSTSFWRIGLALLATLAAYLLAKPVVEALLNTIRSRVDKRVRCVRLYLLRGERDVPLKHYMLTHLWWLLFLVIVREVVANYILDLGAEKSDVMLYLGYVVAIPLVLGTFAMRKVVTNLFIRYFHWDRSSSDYDARIFVVTETIKFLCVVLILVEIFYVFFQSNELMSYLIVVVFLSVELVAILSGFTVVRPPPFSVSLSLVLTVCSFLCLQLKNVATGLFLIFAEPFRTGSECRVRHLVGFIERVSLARTIMRRTDGSRIFVPNGIFADSHQTSGNPLDAHTHTLMLQLHPSTSSGKTQELVDELQAVLPALAMAPEAAAALGGARRNAFTSNRPSSGSSGDDSVTNRRISAASSAGNAEAGGTPRARRVSSAVDATGRALPPPPPPVRVQLHAMFKIKVTVLVDRERFRSLEDGKTEVRSRRACTRQ